MYYYVIKYIYYILREIYMTIRENLIFKYKNRFILFNLYNLKKLHLTEIEYLELLDIEKNKKDLPYKYKQLNKGKQFLSQEDIIIINNIAIKRRKILDKNANLDLSGIQINLSNKCNLACSYCYQNKNLDNRIDENDINSIYHFYLEFISKIKQHSKLEIITISGGEPLMKENLDNINYIANKFEYKNLNIFTNGINLKKYWTYLPISKITAFQISLDGEDSIISKISFNNKKTDVFGKILDGIKLSIENGDYFTAWDPERNSVPLH